MAAINRKSSIPARIPRLKLDSEIAGRLHDKKPLTNLGLTKQQQGECKGAYVSWTNNGRQGTFSKFFNNMYYSKYTNDPPLKPHESKLGPTISAKEHSVMTDFSIDFSATESRVAKAVEAIPPGVGINMTNVRTGRIGATVLTDNELNEIAAALNSQVSPTLLRRTMKISDKAMIELVRAHKAYRAQSMPIKFSVFYSRWDGSSPDEPVMTKARHGMELSYDLLNGMAASLDNDENIGILPLSRPQVDSVLAWYKDWNACGRPNSFGKFYRDHNRGKMPAPKPQKVERTIPYDY